MTSKLHGERMELPEMESAPRSSSIAPPYSIAPMGFDVRPAAAPPHVGRSAVVGAFTAGSLFGALLMGTVALAFYAARPATTSPAALLAALPPVVAAAPIVLAPPSPVLGSGGVTDPAAANPSGAVTAPVADNATPGSSGVSSAPATPGGSASSKGTRSAPHRASTRKAKDSGAGSSLGTAASDDAFMKAIRASSH